MKSLTIIIVLAFAVVNNTYAKDKISVKEIFDQFCKSGLTCEVQETLVMLDKEQHAAFVGLVHEKIPPENLNAIIESRNKECHPTDISIKDIQEKYGESDVPQKAISPKITDTYVVEFIEETSGSGGYYPYSIFRDAEAYGWMCNGGSSEWPADFIAQYYVPNSYSNRSSLRIRGTNAYASCYISNSTASRVYSDNDIRACFGYWTIFFCVWPYEPTTYESVIWIE